MKKIFTLSFFGFFLFSLQAQHFVSRTLIGSFSKAQVDSILNANGIPTILFHGTYAVNAYKIIYNTLDYDSTVKQASGMLAIPQNLDCPLPLVSYGHGTTSVKEDVPSRMNGEGIVGLVSASNGVVMCEPDYTGMGDGTWPHYYLHAFTQAMCNIDLIRAVREVCTQDSVELSNELYLSGYSQGGFQTMATHKYMQTYFPNEFSVTKSFPGAGSYDMSGAMVDLMLSDSSYPSPGYLPFLICTWNPIYHFYTNPSEYLKYPYDSILPPLVDGLHSIDDLNDYMPDTPKLIFKPEVIDTFAHNPNHPFRLALAANDVYKWVPQVPMTLVHCQHDRQVPIQNTYNAYNYFVQHGVTQIDTIDPNPSLGHGDCGQLYFIVLKNYLDSVSAVNACLLGVKKVPPDETLEIFPNPVHEEFTVRCAGYVAGKNPEVEIYDAVGRKVCGMKLTSESQKIKTQGWSSGLYLLRYSSSSGWGMKKLLVE